jgi:hypothetical protein
MSVRIPILNELDRLKKIHSSSKVVSSTFQPDDEDQKKMILHNISVKIVSFALKKEIKNYKEKVLKKQRLQGNMSSPNKIGSRAQTAPSHRITFAGRNDRPSTASLSLPDEKADFGSVLKSHVTADHFQEELNRQVYDKMNDAKRVFDAIYSDFSGAMRYEFSPYHSSEEIDASDYATPAVVSLLPSYNPLKMLDDSSGKKKEGLAIIIDPTINTCGEKVTLRLTYKRPKETGEEEVVKDHVFWSSGNYFGNRLTVVPDTTGIPDSAPSSLPGWQGRPPIVIPALIFTAEIMKNTSSTRDYSSGFRLSKLKIVATACMNTKGGIKKYVDFCNDYFVALAANTVIPGRVSALNFACLHGNMEAVASLVANGADINWRHAESLFTTALHEAVAGGHEAITKFLLEHGANQVRIYAG